MKIKYRFGWSSFLCRLQGESRVRDENDEIRIVVSSKMGYKECLSALVFQYWRPLLQTMKSSRSAKLSSAYSPDASCASTNALRLRSCLRREPRGGGGGGGAADGDGSSSGAACAACVACVTSASGCQPRCSSASRSEAAAYRTADTRARRRTSPSAAPPSWL